MSLGIDEAAVLTELRALLAGEDFQRGLANLTADPFFVAFFLASVSQGEGLGEAAVAMIGQDELARRIHDLRRQHAEERAHKQRTLVVARELFPEFFEDDSYRYADALQGRVYYVRVLETNRTRLEQRGRHTRLNLYLTTTFAYEVMVLLLYRAFADAVARAPLPETVRSRVATLLEGILAEEATHLGVIGQHEALLASPREELSPEAGSMLDALARLTADDYLVPAGYAVREVVSMLGRYADAERYRAEIRAGGGAGG